MKNIAYILLGILISLGLTATAYYIKDIDETGKKITTEVSEYKYATTTFAGVEKYQEELRESQRHKELMIKLDIIIKQLEK